MIIAYNMKLSLYHVIAISTAVSISLIWVYWKVNKLERHLKDINTRLSTNTSNLNNLCTSLELEREGVKDCTKGGNSDALTVASAVSASDNISDDDVDEIMAELNENADVYNCADEMSCVETKANADLCTAFDAGADAEADADADADADACAQTSENVCEEYSHMDAVATSDPESDTSYKALLSPDNWIFTEDELKKKTVEDLKQFLASKQQSVKGVKKDLVQRIIDLVK